jgi:hypothetical protein
MTPPVSVFRNDLRGQAFEKAFPDSPEFAAYLSRYVIAHDDPYDFALVLIQGLQACCGSQMPPPVVSRDCVLRLSVEEDVEAVGRINQAISRCGINLVRACVTFTMWLRCRMDPKTGHINVREWVDEGVIRRYLHVFCCAFAMLAGLQIDPRAVVA